MIAVPYANLLIKLKNSKLKRILDKPSHQILLSVAHKSPRPEEINLKNHQGSCAAPKKKKAATIVKGYQFMVEES